MSRLEAEGLSALFARLAERFELWAPVRLKMRGRLSDTDSIRYAPVTAPAEVEWQEKSAFSAKEILFPPVDTLAHFAADATVPAAAPARPVLAFLRSCDIHAIDRLDAVFLAEPADALYAARRRNLRFALIDCPQPWDSCFCVSMGTDRADGWAFALRVEADGSALLRAGNGVSDPALAGLLPDGDWQPRGPGRDGRPVRLPDPDALEDAIQTRDLFGHPFWADFGRRCIACGRCNYSCPTCSCSETVDIADEEDPALGARRRVWSACHVDRFADMAGGHAFRKEYGDRMRFKAMHKIHDFRRRTGRHMCIGCGRCDDQCPEYISFAACIDGVSGLLSREGAHD